MGGGEGNSGIGTGRPLRNAMCVFPSSALLLQRVPRGMHLGGWSEGLRFGPVPTGLPPQSPWPTAQVLVPGCRGSSSPAGGPPVLGLMPVVLCSRGGMGVIHSCSPWGGISQASSSSVVRGRSPGPVLALPVLALCIPPLGDTGDLQVVEVIGLVTVWSTEGIEHHLVLPVIGHIVIVRVPGSRPSSGPLRVVLVLDPSPCGPKATEEDDVDLGHSALSPQGPPKAAGGSRELEVAARLLPEAVLKAGWPCCTKGRRVRQRPPVEPGSPRSPRLPRDCSQRLH